MGAARLCVLTLWMARDILELGMGVFFGFQDAGVGVGLEIRSGTVLVDL